MTIKPNIKVNLLENLSYYKINKNINYKEFNYYIVDGVKKSFFYDIDKFVFLTVIGYVSIVKERLQFGNPFIFYSLSSYYRQNLPKLLKNYIKEYILIENIDILKSVENLNTILKNIDLNRTNMFIVFFEINSDFTWPINEYLENYTTYLMLSLESFYIYSLFHYKFNNNSFIISDGNILKLKNIIKTINSERVIGLIKNQQENYYKYIELQNLEINLDKYLYNLPYQNRTAYLEINYTDLKVNTFYFNPFSFNSINFYNILKSNSILRIENISNSNSNNYLDTITSFILSLTEETPSLYFRMPENNIILTKLENYLKKFLPSETVIKYMLI
ncbi:MAG: hypothetical protein N2485_00305 [bacterium]|nr:hypothetical protein [bacterium]